MRGAAQHMLSELYLALGIQLESENKLNEAQSAFQKAVEYANDVIDGGIYFLVDSRFGTRKNEEFVSINIHKNGVDDPTQIVDTLQMKTNHYWDLFQEGNVNYQEGNPECIWAAQIDYDAYKAEDGKSKLNYSRTYGPVFRDGAPAHITGTLEDVGGTWDCSGNTYHVYT